MGPGNGTLEVHFLQWYHPYQGGKNKMHLELDKIFQFGIKQVKPDCKHRAEEDFVKPFQNMITSLANTEKSLLMIIPGSQEGSISPPLEKIVKELCSKHPGRYIDGSTILYRHKSISKMAQGGSREIEVHLGSIKINDKNELLKAALDVILIDDVCTTGNSLRACRKIISDFKLKTTVSFYTMVMTCADRKEHQRDEACECYGALIPRKCGLFSMKNLLNALPNPKVSFVTCIPRRKCNSSLLKISQISELMLFHMVFVAATYY